MFALLLLQKRHPPIFNVSLWSFMSLEITQANISYIKLPLGVTSLTNMHLPVLWLLVSWLSWLIPLCYKRPGNDFFQMLSLIHVVDRLWMSSGSDGVSFCSLLPPICRNYSQFLRLLSRFLQDPILSRIEVPRRRRLNYNFLHLKNKKLKISYSFRFKKYTSPIYFCRWVYKSGALCFNIVTFLNSLKKAFFNEVVTNCVFLQTVYKKIHYCI